MTNLEIYAMMSLAAYDERRSPVDDTVGPIVGVLNSLEWQKIAEDNVEGATWSNIPEDGSEYSQSGMQADIWEQSTSGEIVIAFRGTESSRADSENDDFRGTDGAKDKSTLSNWSYINKFIAQLAIANDDLRADVADQFLDAVTIVQETIDTYGAENVTLTGHSLGGALAALVSIYFALEKKIILQATIIDPAPFEHEGLLANAAIGFNNDTIPGPSEQPEEVFLVDKAADALEYLTSYDYIKYHYIDNSITDTVYTTLDPPEGISENKIVFLNEGEAKPEFLHSPALHLLVADLDRQERLMALEEKIPNLLRLLEDGDLLGLLGSVDAGEQGLKSDYSYDVTLSLLAINPVLFDLFEASLNYVAASDGLLSELDGVYFLLQNSTTVYEDAQTLLGPNGEPLSIKEFFVSLGLQGIREYARSISNEHEGGILFDAETRFWGNDEQSEVIATRLDVYSPPSHSEENRLAFGSIQSKELFAHLAFPGHSTGFANLVHENLDDGVVVTGVMAEANGGNNATFEEAALTNQVTEGEHNFVFLGGAGSDRFNLTLSGHSYVWGNSETTATDGDHASFESVAVPDDKAGIFLEQQPTQSIRTLDLDGWKAYRGDAANPSHSALLFDVEQITLSDGNDTAFIRDLGDSRIFGGLGYDSAVAVGEVLPDLSDGIQVDDATSTVPLIFDYHDHSIEHLVGGAGNDVLYAATSEETAPQTVTLTLRQDPNVDPLIYPAPYRDNINDHLAFDSGSTRVIDYTGYNIVEGGAGDDVLKASPTAGADGSFESLDASETGYQNKSLLLGGIGNDTYEITAGTGKKIFYSQHSIDYSHVSADYTDYGWEVEIYDVDGAGKIIVGGIDISQFDLLQHASGPLPANQAYYSIRGPNGEVLADAEEGGQVGILAGYFGADLHLTVSTSPDAPGNTSGKALASNIVIRDFTPGDFGIDMLRYWEEALSSPNHITYFGDPGGYASHTVASLQYGGTDVDDVLTGSSQDNTLLAGAGNDTISGQEGQDFLIGGTGNDTLSGGLGADTYFFSSGDGIDVINDFDFLEDELVLNENVLRPISIPDQMTFSQIGSDVVVDYGAGDTVTLINVDLQGWKDHVGAPTEFFGTDLADIIVGSDGEDFLYGLGGDDQLDGGEDNDYLYGQDGSDTLIGGNGNNYLFGGTGDDYFIAGAGLDSFDGGEGTDTVSYLNSLTGIGLNLYSPASSFGFAQDDTFEDIEILRLTNFQDNAFLDRSMTVFGEAGDDAIFGSDQADVLYGNAGVDRLEGGAGDDLIIGGIGNDRLEGGAGSDLFKLTTGDGIDSIYDFNIDEDSIEIDGDLLNPNILPNGISLTQSTFYVELAYGSGDIVFLHSVDLSAWQLANPPPSDGMVTGTSGNDVIDASYVDSDGDRINDSGQIIGAGTGDDTVYSGAGNDRIDADSGNDLIVSGAGNDRIFAGSGDDTIIYHSGDDLIAGHHSNKGTDTLDLSQYSSDQVSFLNDGNNTLIETPDGTITLSYQHYHDIGADRTNIESILFSDGALDQLGIRDRGVSDQSTEGNDTIEGTKFGEVFVDKTGNDRIFAGSGDDTIIYHSGDDLIAGHHSNKGTDTLDLSQYSSDQVSFLNDGNNTLIETPDGTITLSYQHYHDIGADRTNIESILFSDGALDQLGIRDRGVSDQSTEGNDTIEGTKFGEVFVDKTGNDRIFAGSGDDTIIYHSGDDLIAGHHSNKGTDTLDLSQYSSDQVSFLNDGNNTLIETPDGTITLSYQHYHDIGADRTNIESILFSDGALDQLGIRDRGVSDQSTEGNDTIEGTRWRDRIDGGEGDDVLIGHSGADIFVFRTDEGNDIITDFEDDIDVISLEGTGLSYADLIITDMPNGALVDVAGTGTITLGDIVASSVNEDDFVFV